MNFDCKENGGKKALLVNPKHQYSVYKWGEHDCCAHNNKNINYNEYPSWSPFTDEHYLQGKWWKEKLFL